MGQNASGMYIVDDNYNIVGFNTVAEHMYPRIKKEEKCYRCLMNQEVLPHVAKWLKENLNEYYVIGCGRGANLRDEQMSIAYRRDRINLISMKTWWLSQTPDVPGSRYEEQSSCPRTATEAGF